MCGACGILAGAPDWVEGGEAASGAVKLQERRRRIALVNRLLAPGGTHLREFGGRLVLQSATGRTRIVTELAHVWLEADEIGCRPVGLGRVRGLAIGAGPPPR
jgi:hypothetical protein